MFLSDFSKGCLIEVVKPRQFRTNTSPANSQDWDS